MLSKDYINHIYHIVGEAIEPGPTKLFDPAEVYLFIDKKLKLFWVWSGSESRLFHRYIAAQWAGKLKVRPNFYGFRYEVIKQDREPKEFLTIMNEIREDSPEFKYPGESRISDDNETYNFRETNYVENTQNSTILNDQGISISDVDKKKVKKLLNEIEEIHQHIKYSINHIEKRIREIRNVINKQ